jgi:hypothetical protein
LTLAPVNSLSPVSLTPVNNLLWEIRLISEHFFDINQNCIIGTAWFAIKLIRERNLK